jgi:hypothetical protein
MSANFSSVQIRMDDRETVMRVIEEISRKQKQKLLVGPALGGWIGVYPKWSDYTKLCRAIVRRLNAELFSLEIKYEDVFRYEYYRETAPRSQSHRNQTSERAWETLAGWPSNSGITPPYAADRESRLYDVGSKLRIPRRARERNHVADIDHARDIDHRPLEAEPKAGVRDGAKTP